MKHLRLFPDTTVRNSILANIDYKILSKTEGEPGVGIQQGTWINPKTLPFYIDVREPVTLAATSGLQMSTDCENWNDTTAMTLPIGRTYFRVASDQESPLKPNWIEDNNSDYDIGGNINSLVKVNFEEDTTCYVFYDGSGDTGFFQDKAKLKRAGNLVLPATTLLNNCYKRMFRNCTSLTAAPELPATTLADNCYDRMFFGCELLTTAPALPATTLADSCYFAMLANCGSLITAPVLPATTLANRCYGNMFQSCVSLTTAPELPATTLASSCYGNMFTYCSSLATAPVLPATTLAPNCYQAMFNRCTSLTTAPELPAETLADNCYNTMFCHTSLTTAPALPAETMAFACYKWMFEYCPNLTNAPELPATTLAKNCYTGMFKDCPSMTTPPELPATTLAEGCYQQLFQNSPNINNIKCLATDISATNCTTNWTDGVAATGTFVKNPNMSGWTTGTSGIPSGWTVQDAA